MNNLAIYLFFFINYLFFRKIKLKYCSLSRSFLFYFKKKQDEKPLCSNIHTLTLKNIRSRPFWPCLTRLVFGVSSRNKMSESSTSSNTRVFKVVVTGFGPFQNVPENESWLAVSGLWNEALPSSIRLVTRELPVVYDIVKREVPALWDAEKPDVRNTMLYILRAIIYQVNL